MAIINKTLDIRSITIDRDRRQSYERYVIYANIIHQIWKLKFRLDDVVGSISFCDNRSIIYDKWLLHCAVCGLFRWKKNKDLAYKSLLLHWHKCPGLSHGVS